jgi:hypothetical protein
MRTDNPHSPEKGEILSNYMTAYRRSLEDLDVASKPYDEDSDPQE